MADASQNKIAIWNRACAIARQGKTISSPTEESNLARICRMHWDDARKEALGSFEWGFATRTVELEKTNAPENSGFKYMFAIPQDNIVILGIFSSFSAADMKKPLPTPEVIVAQDNKTYIASNHDSIIAKYIQDNENYDFWNPKFKEYLAHCLAMLVAESLDLTSTKLQEISQLKTLAQSVAASTLSTEKDNKDVSKDRRYISARRS